METFFAFYWSDNSRKLLEAALDNFSIILLDRDAEVTVRDLPTSSSRSRELDAACSRRILQSKRAKRKLGILFYHSGIARFRFIHSAALENRRGRMISPPQRVISSARSRLRYTRAGIRAGLRRH